MNTPTPRPATAPLTAERLQELACDVTDPGMVMGPLDAADLSAACLELLEARKRKPRATALKMQFPKSLIARELRDAGALAGAGPLGARLINAGDVIDVLCAAVATALASADVAGGEFGHLLRHALVQAGA